MTSRKRTPESTPGTAARHGDSAPASTEGVVRFIVWTLLMSAFLFTLAVIGFAALRLYG